ncbi:hypothetical protein GCM10025860_18370 [Methanobacterium ferruginis]|nr:hypothetical protein GCM10025860_18370 [Methanobacterium ferruginis]
MWIPPIINIILVYHRINHPIGKNLSGNDLNQYLVMQFFIKKIFPDNLRSVLRNICE